MTDIPPPFPLGHEEPSAKELPRSPEGEESQTDFKHVLIEKTTDRAKSSAPRSVEVRAGDTLSEIVHRALKKRGIPFSTPELYQWVDNVAQANGLANPDLIYPGQKIDLSVLYGQPATKVAMTQSMSALPTFTSPVSGRISSEFGMRVHPIDNVPHFHHGIDIAAPRGTQVACASGGMVIFAARRGMYGNCVDIDHGGGWLTRYAHLDSVTVQVNQEVRAGNEIGTVGESGRTTGPHLHFELHRDGRRVNPLPFLPLGAGPTAAIAAHHDREKEDRPV